MKNELDFFISNILNRKIRYLEVNENIHLYNYYVKCCNEIDDYYKIEDVQNIIYNSKYLSLYIKMLNTFNFDELYSSELHGLSHVIRCSYLALIYSCIEELTEYEFSLLLISLFYHDIGRNHDMDDNMHGYKSANKLDFLKSVVNYDELQSIKTIIICHCLEDNEYDLIFKTSNIKNPKLIKKLLLIVNI